LIANFAHLFTSMQSLVRVMAATTLTDECLDGDDDATTMAALATPCECRCECE